MFNVTFFIIFVYLLSLLLAQRLQDAVETLTKSRARKFAFTSRYQIVQAQVVPLQLDPNPTEVLQTICSQLLVKNVSTILYMTNAEIWGSNAASAQYLLQLTTYLGIPVIAWNDDNMGLGQQNAAARILQLAPSVDHQAR